jgi:HPt (histidine-containing phosphotransfer) domain-containing protein
MPEPAVIDLQAVENLRALNPGDQDEFIREITGIFLEDTPLRITELDLTLASGDMAKFARAAHSIKGSSANLGADALKAVAAQLEDHTRKPAPVAAELAPLVARLKVEFERARAELNRLFPA